jgi:hypothetical protein
MGTYAEWMRDQSQSRKSRDAKQDTLEALARMRLTLKDQKARDRKAITEPRGSNVRFSVGGSDPHQERAQSDSRGVGANFQHRANDGTFHTNVASHDRLAAHLVGPSHRMAILPSWRSSTKSMALAHEAAHVNRPQDHGVGSIEE